MKNSINHLINQASGGVEILLLARIAFRALQANPAAFVVDMIYKITDILIWPVNYIFPNIPVGGSVFDVVAVSAMIFYGVIYFLAHRLINSI